jgi:hypothetical protein
MFKQFRRTVAGNFGRIEHHSGELLGIVLWIEVFIYHWHFSRLLPALLWLIYFVSHRLEKKIYGKFGYR